MKESESTAGWIYVLWNPAFPKFVKIGRAADIEERIRTLNTAVPYKFQLVAQFHSENAPAAEKAIHRLLHAASPSKCDSDEFFRLTRDNAAAFVATIAGQRGTEWQSFCYFKDGKRYDSYGAPYVDPLPSVSEVLRNTVFHTAKKGSSITMRVDGPRAFTVLKGSRLEPSTRGLSSSKRAHEILIRQLRDALSGKLLKNGGIAKDKTFPTPHLAAAVMLGRQSSNGYIDWVDDNGKPLKDYIQSLKG